MDYSLAEKGVLSQGAISESKRRQIKLFAPTTSDQGNVAP